MFVLTWTTKNSSILAVITVHVWIGRTVHQSCFISYTGHHVQDDGAIATAIECTRESQGPLESEASLPACYLSINISPRVVTDCAPVVVCAHFNATFDERASTNQSNISICAY